MSGKKRKHDVPESEVSEEESDDVPLDMVADVVQYLLISDRKKIPVKRTEIVKNAMKGESRVFNEVFKQACDRIENSFGIKVAQVPDKNNIQFILINSLDATPLPMDKPPEYDVTNGILIPVLAVIFMSDGSVKEDVIWNFLSALGFDLEAKNHLPYIGYSIRDLLTNLWIKQLYLQYTKTNTGEISEYFFQWGFRATQQFDKLEILNFVCEMYGGNMKPTSWKLQHVEATKKTK